MSEKTIQHLSDEGNGLTDTTQLQSAWTAVVEQAPAMGRLPEMVTALYVEEMYDTREEFLEEQRELHARTRRGLILFNDIIGPQGLNLLFEEYDVKLGTAVEAVVDVVEEECAATGSVGKKYTAETLCGWLLGSLALEICRESVADWLVAIDFDCGGEQSYHNLVGLNNPLLTLAHVISRLKFDVPNTEQLVHQAAKELIWRMGLELTEATPQTTYH